jgi:tetratricopeptide (TPR) repeat protein
LKPALFRKQKLPETYRVICLGGSSMFGTPYEMTATIPGIVRKQLRHLYPDRDIEVINAAASAINSNVVYDLSKDLARLEPDLVLIYMGHNEFYGPDGVGAAFLAKAIPASIQWKYQLRDLRIVAGLLKLFWGDDASARSHGDRNLMREVSRGALVSSGDVAAIVSRFESNLSSIVAFWQSAGVPVILSDVTSNLMFPPFAYDSTALGGYTADAVIASFHAGDLDRCRQMLQAPFHEDSTNAFVRYWLGRIALQRGDYESARRNLIAARDHDLLKFRAPGEINAALRHAAERFAVPVISADSMFAALSPGGVPGEHLFWEHLHPTVAGYYHIAGAFVEKIVSNRYIDEGTRSHDLLPFDVDSLSIAWMDLAYADLSIAHLTGRWPFTNYHRDPVVLNRADDRLRSIAQAVYRREIVWDQGCYETAALFWRRGRTRDARTTYEALLEEYPRNFYTHYLLGSLLLQTRENQQAKYHLRASIESNPEFPNSRIDYALSLINTGEFKAAIDELEQAMKLKGVSGSAQLLASAHYGLSAALANMGDYTRALTHVDEALKLRPEYPEAQALRVGIARVAEGGR